MKILLNILCFIFFIAEESNAQQRIIAECTIEYKVVSVNSNDTDLQTSMQSATQTVYIKGNNSRVDLISPSYQQTTFFDKSTGTATILREFGNNKFISKLNNDEWMEANKIFEGATVTLQNETKKILTYPDCKKAILKLKNGSLLTVFYVPNLVPSVKEFQYQFKNIPGLVLDFETTGKNQSAIHYTATQINFNPVPAQIFNIPTTGYRLLN